MEKPSSSEDNSVGILTVAKLQMTLIDEKVGRKDEKDGMKVLILHSEDNSDYAKFLLKYFDKLNLRATAECELTVFKMMFSISYIKAAIDWADVVVVLVNNSYLSYIKCVDFSVQRSNSSLHARHAFKVLQHKIYNDNNFIAVAAVPEGTKHNCDEFSELKKCIHVKNDYKELGETILQLHEINKKIQTIS